MTDQKVRTCDVYRTDPNLPSRFNNPDCFSGYSQKKIHPLYRTSNQIYGSKKPTVHEMQTQFKGTSHQFSMALLHSGMYCDNGFNTSLETGMVTTSASTQKRREDIHNYRHCLNQCSDGNKG